MVQAERDSSNRFRSGARRLEDSRRTALEARRGVEICGKVWVSNRRDQTFWSGSFWYCGTL